MFLLYVIDLLRAGCKCLNFPDNNLKCLDLTERNLRILNVTESDCLLENDH